MRKLPENDAARFLFRAMAERFAGRMFAGTVGEKWSRFPGALNTATGAAVQADKFYLCGV